MSHSRITSARCRKPVVETLETRRLLDSSGLTGAELADLDDNGVVNFADFLRLSRNFGNQVESRAQGDIDCDGVVGFPDFLTLSGHFGERINGNGNNGQGPDRRPVKPRGQLASSQFRQSRAAFTDSIGQSRNNGRPFQNVDANAEGIYYPVLVAGSASATPTDSPDARIDPNTTTSPYAGVGSIEVTHPDLGTFLCTGTPITPTHVLSAGHCFDIDSDGTPDDGLTVRFYLNNGSDLSSTHVASSIEIHPDFGGFNTGGVHDDLSIIGFDEALPADTPIYPLSLEALSIGHTLELVGYGLSGFGDSGYSVDPTYVDKRVGVNAADLFIVEDDVEGSDVHEVFMYDFDDPAGGEDFFPGASLGNDVETTVGGGDSGGPAFIDIGGTKTIFGINTFSYELAGVTAPVGFFDSLGGGVILAPYADWIATVASGAVPSNNAPSFNASENVVVSEDAGSIQIDWAANITANDSGQATEFEILSNSNPDLFATPPQLAPDGQLTFATMADANGSASLEVVLRDDGGTQFNGIDTSPIVQLTITVEPVNDQPTFAIQGDVVVDLDAGAQLIPNFLTNFEPGGGESEQSIAEVILTHDNEALFLSAPSVDTDGALSFTPAAEASGQATVMLSVRDTGGTQNGGIDQSEIQSFTITVNELPDSDPLFSLTGDVFVEEDSGRHTVPMFVTDVHPDIVDFLLTHDNLDLFSQEPDIRPGGQLQFATSDDAFGVAEVTVTGIDEDGSTVDVAGFAIVVSPIDDDAEEIVSPALMALRDRFKTRILTVESLPQRQALHNRMMRITAQYDGDSQPLQMQLSALRSQLSALADSTLLPAEPAAELLDIIDQMLDALESQ